MQQSNGLKHPCECPCSIRASTKAKNEDSIPILIGSHQISVCILNILHEPAPEREPLKKRPTFRQSSFMPWFRHRSHATVVKCELPRIFSCDLIRANYI